MSIDLVNSINDLSRIYLNKKNVVSEMKRYRMVLQLLENIWSKRGEGPIAISCEEDSVIFTFADDTEIIKFEPDFQFCRLFSGGHFLDTVSNTSRRKHIIESYQKILETISIYQDKWTIAAERNAIISLLNFWHSFFQSENNINFQSFWSKILKHKCHYLCLESESNYQIYYLDKIYRSNIKSSHKLKNSVVVFMTDGSILSFRPVLLKRDKLRIRLKFELVTPHILETHAIVKKKTK